MKPSFYIPVQGTHGWDENPNLECWWENGSDFSRFLFSRNLIQFNPVLPFQWSTELDGLFRPSHIVWKAAGYALRYYIGDHLPSSGQRIPQSARNIIAHSHGGQVVFYACAGGMRVQNLVTVGTPVRGDMEGIIKLARPNIANWTHICDSKADLISIAGAISDGRFRLRHTMELADRNDDCRDLGISHSRILNTPPVFSLWDSRGWLNDLVR